MSALAESAMANSMLLGEIVWQSVFFYFFATIACVFGAAVLFTSNIVRMAFYLVISLASTAGLFFLAGAEFIGAMQIMIYVGGTLVLLIFGVMLTAQEAFVSMKTGGGEWVLGLGVGGVLLVIMVAVAFNVPDWRTPRQDADQLAVAVTQADTVQMGMALAGARVDAGVSPEVAYRHGISGYLVAFEVVGIHLLVVLVGAAYLSRSKRFTGRQSRAVSTFEVRPRVRGGLVSAVVLAGIAVNLLLAVLTFARGSHFLEEFPQVIVRTPPEWLFPVVSLLFLLNVLLLAVVWGGQRWGLIALWLVPIAQAILLGTNGFEPPFAAGVGVALLVPVALLTAVVCVGRPSYWSQMD